MSRNDEPAHDAYWCMVTHNLSVLQLCISLSWVWSAALQILAKLASGMHKPSQQTLVPLAAVQGLLKDLPIPKLRQLGGKFGDELMASLSIKTVGQHSTNWASCDYAYLLCHWTNRCAA